MNAEKNSVKSGVLLISSLLIVGTIGIFRRYIPLSSALLAFVRGLIGSAVLGLFVLARGTGRWQRIGRKKFWGLAVNGVFLGINWILLFEAYNYTTIAAATLCYYIEPTIVLLLSPLIFKEKLTAKKLICAAVALLGMVFVSGVLNSGGAPSDDMRGILFGLGAGVFYAIVVMLNKKIGEVDAYQKTMIQLSSAAVVLIPYLLMTEDFGSIALDGTVIGLLLVVGIIHTGLFYVLYFGSMSGLKAQTISTLSYIDPLAALMVSVLFLKESMTVQGVIGAVLIIGSAVISELGQE